MSLANSEVAEVGLLIKKLEKERNQEKPPKRRERIIGKCRNSKIHNHKNHSDMSMYEQATFAEILRGK